MCTLKTEQTLQAQLSTSGGRKHITNKNSEQWMQVEVRQLVNGASEYGVRKWKDVKTNFFIASIQTPLYLKVHVDAQ